MCVEYLNAPLIHKHLTSSLCSEVQLQFFSFVIYNNYIPYNHMINWIIE